MCETTTWFTTSGYFCFDCGNDSDTACGFFDHKSIFFEENIDEYDNV